MKPIASSCFTLALLFCSFLSPDASAANVPTNLTATVNSPTQITLTWTDTSTDEIGFTFAFDTNSAFTNATWIWTGGANVTSYVHTSRTPGTTYYYKIKAEGATDAQDSALSSAVYATTPPAVMPISDELYGINAWMPYQIGSHVFYGSLHTQWSNIDASGATSMRYGGNGADQWADPSWSNATDSTLKQYVDLVNEMQSRGIEPVLQVPVYGGLYDANDAAAIVYHVNVVHGKNVKLWSIGNEPDLASGAYNYTTAAQVAAYIRPFASAMKAVDPTIKIMGPENAWYNPTIMNGLTTPGGADDITGKDANGRYYIDFISFHHYNGFNGSQTRSQVINSLTQSGGYNDTLATLQTRLNAANAHHSRANTSPIRIAITEANVNYANASGDSVTGTGAKSFLGGQWWAEFLGISMKHGVSMVTFWSTIEGNELGYVSGDGTTKRPTYHHFKIVADHFRGNVAATTDNQSLVKTFASKASDQTAVLLLNQEETASHTYTVRLNMASIVTGSTLKVNVDGGQALETSGTIAPQSTILLVFDASGVLRKKVEYKANGHANLNLAPSVTTYP